MRFLSVGCLCALSLSFLSELAAKDITISSPPHQWQSLNLPLDSWGTVVFEARNPTDRPEECFLTSYFVDRADQQFGRRFHLPAHSILQEWYLVKTPSSDGSQSQNETKSLNSMMIRRHGAIESSVGPGTGERFESSYIRCRKDAQKTLLIADQADEEPLHFVAAARMTKYDPKEFQVSVMRPLPPVAAAYEPWTHIILASNRILEDQAAVEALRQWTLRGGSLWILLDKTGVDAALPFLADAGGLTVVDRVGLTTFHLTTSRTDFKLSGESRELEAPAEMVRVVPAGFEVLCQIDGWAAALSTNVGHGKVLVSTLGPSGWLQTRGQAADRRWRTELSESGYPTEECLSLGEMFWGAEKMIPPADVAEIATSYVGYRITSWAWVAWTLAVFCGAVLAAGLVLWRSKRLTWLAWVAPAASVLATACLGISGHRMRTSIPPTEASIQVVEADSLGNVQIEGGLSVYSVSNGDTQPKVTRGGRLEFVHPPVGQAKRLVWSDCGSSHWENLDLNTGMHEFRFETYKTRPPSLAVLSLNEQGVTGRISGGTWDLPQRGLIVSPGGQLAAPRFEGEGRFVSSAKDGLPPGQFSASNVIDDRETTRIRVLRKLFSEVSRLPSRPRLYFWTKSLETGMRTQTEGRKVGEALVGVPLLFERPPPGRSVYLPSYLIDYRSVRHSDRGSSLAYNNRTHRWLDDLVRKGSTTLEFQLPPDLGRLELERLRVSVDINAPNRDFQLVRLDRHKPQETRKLAARKSPVGLLEFELEGESLPPVDEAQRFQLGFDVGPLFNDLAQEAEANRARQAWRFRNVWVEAWAKTPE